MSARGGGGWVGGWVGGWGWVGVGGVGGVLCVRARASACAWLRRAVAVPHPDTSRTDAPPGYTPARTCTHSKNETVTPPPLV